MQPFEQSSKDEMTSLNSDRPKTVPSRYSQLRGNSQHQGVVERWIKVPVRTLAHSVFPVLSSIIANFLPTRFWYSAAFRTTGVLARLCSWYPWKSSGRYRQAQMLHRILSRLSATDREFYVPCRVLGLEALHDEPGKCGLVFCSSHIPLYSAVIRVLVNLGRQDMTIVAKNPRKDNRMGVWGLSTKLPCYRTDSAVLLKARTALRRGGTVLALIDTTEGEYSPNILRLAARVDARVIFFFTELRSDGTIDVLFAKPNYEFYGGEDAIRASLLALDRVNQRIWETGLRPEETVSALANLHVSGL